MTTETRRNGRRRLSWRPARIAGTILLIASAAACGRDFNAFPDLDRPETAVDYDVVVTGAPGERAAELIEESLLVYRRQEVGAQSLALLRRRANADADTVLEILRSLGFYEGTVEVDVDRVGALEPEPASVKGAVSGAAGAVAGAATGAVRAIAGLFRDRPDAVEQPDLIDDEPPPGGYARVTIAIDPGPRFVLAEHDLVLIDAGPEAPPPTIPAARHFGSPVGGPALAAEIVAAEGEALQMLHQIGRPYAEQLDRDSVADLEQNQIEVDTFLATGREYVFGETRIEGAPNVEDDFLLTYRPYVTGERVDTRALEEYQERLIDTNLFDAGSVRLPEEPPIGDSAPVIVKLEERPPRTVAAGLEYSTDLGAAATFSFEHRNLAGRGESVAVEGFGSLEEQRLTTRFRKPQWRRAGQDLTAALGIERLSNEAKAYEGLTFTGRAGVEREIGDFWTLGFGGLGEASFIEDEGEEETFYLAGLPVFAEFDDRDDILNPTRGLRLRGEVTPFVGTGDGSPVSFLKTEMNGATYWGIDEDRDYILAFRGRLGSTLSAGGLDEVPPPRRFYSGGGGSVRGYEDRIIGPLDEDDEPVGGLSVLETAVELRAPVWRDIGLGGVLFIDAGAVSEDLVPTFDEGMQFAAGTGLRYASPVGPIRFDVAFPLNGRDVDDFFEFYISIGQAF